MTQQAPRSLRHEYELYVEREIENYKDSVPRIALLGIGDEAVAALGAQPQLALTELLLCEEVDRIIRQRLRVPTYQAWRRRRLRMIERYRRPEHWGLEPDGALVRAIGAAAERRVLVAGASVEGAALYLAANGCDVTALESTEDVVERVMSAAGAAGLSQRLRSSAIELRDWAPDVPLNAVICTPAAFDGLSATERASVIGQLQAATTCGGVHLVETIVPGRTPVTLEELRTRYIGWDICVEGARSASDSFLARKALA